MNKEMVKLINTLDMIEMDKQELLQSDCDDYDQITQNLIDLFVRSKDLKESVVKVLTRIKHERKRGEK